MDHWSDSLMGYTGSLILGISESMIGSSDSTYSLIGSYHSLIVDF